MLPASAVTQNSDQIFPFQPFVICFIRTHKDNVESIRETIFFFVFSPLTSELFLDLHVLNKLLIQTW